MIELRQLSFSRAGRVLVRGATAQFHKGQRIGIVGANGCGKSSFFDVVLGDLIPDEGDINIPKCWLISHVAQEVQGLDRQAIEFVKDGDAILRACERELREANLAQDGLRVATALEAYRDAGGYSATPRAEALLHGLGFDATDFLRPVAEFSGGWRGRLNLARALMSPSDLLLLDEPTNHLDLEAVIWLESWLSEFRGTLLLISHDREFLDRVVDWVGSIENDKLELYRGGYSAFERLRAARMASRQSEFAAQARRVAALSAFVERFRAKATKARQAQSRLKTLERIGELAPAHFDAPFEFSLRQPASLPDILLSLEMASAGYAGMPIVENVSMVLRPGDRIGLLGRNGAGKSTLMKALAGIEPVLSGFRRDGKGLSVGYFAQHQVEALRSDESPFQHLARADNTAREQELRDFLGGFAFSGDLANVPVGRMSGGERSRLALAIIVWLRPNLLLLDEPTNHLDVEMRHALGMALQQYSGALVLVSHDRHLLRKTTDSLVLVANASVVPFDGSLDDYLGSARPGTGAGSTREDTMQPNSKRHDRREAALFRTEQGKRIRPLRQRLAAIDSELAQLERDLAEIDGRLGEADYYQTTDSPRLQSDLKRQAELRSRIDMAESEWLNLSAELDQLT